MKSRCEKTVFLCGLNRHYSAISPERSSLFVRFKTREGFRSLVTRHHPHPRLQESSSGDGQLQSISDFHGWVASSLQHGQKGVMQYWRLITTDNLGAKALLELVLADIPSAFALLPGSRVGRLAGTSHCCMQPQHLKARPSSLHREGRRPLPFLSDTASAVCCTSSSSP